MVLEMPTSAEKKRFDDLQKQGLLPSEALKKIETERRLGIVPEDKPKFFSITRENWWFYAAMGTLGIGVLYVYIKSPKPTTQSASMSSLSNDTDNASNTNNTYSTDEFEYVELYPMEFIE